MNGLKRWISKTAYIQTGQRLDTIVDYIETNGWSEKRKMKLELELENLSRLLYESPERESLLAYYKNRIERIKNEQ